MKLLELAKKNLQEYISVRETLEFIASTQQTPLSYVAVFLISQNFDTNIATYDVDRFFIVHSNDDFNWGTFQYTNSILSNLADNEKYKEIFVFDENDLPENLKDVYWKRSELYNLNLIKDLSISYYFRAEDIKNIIGNHPLNLKEFESNGDFSDDEVIKLLKSGMPLFASNKVEKLSLIDDFVNSIINFFDGDFNKGFTIQKDELKKLLFKLKIIIKGFNDDFSEEKSPIFEPYTSEMTPNINDENYLKIIEEELIYLPKIEIEVIKIDDQNISNKVIDLSFNDELNILIKSDYFDLFDSACLMSLDEPSKLNSDINYSDDWNYGEHKQAIKVLSYAINAKKLTANNGLIPRASLQNFLFECGYIIKGFNENFETSADSKNTDNSTIEQLKIENEKLQAELLEKDQRIKKLELLEQKDNSSLLSLIFDDTQTERYAPDLALSIKLWEHLYIKDVTNTDKHSNRSNHWVSKNTPYKNETSIEVKRLREVTSPFESWHVDRKNKFNK